MAGCVPLRGTGPSPEARLEQETREAVEQMNEGTLESSILVPRLRLSEETSFWIQLIQVKLDPKLDNINNVGDLKEKLLDLRNMTVRRECPSPPRGLALVPVAQVFFFFFFLSPFIRRFLSCSCRT